MIRIAGLALLLSLLPVAMAQSPAIPRTSDGHPDFQGIWGSNFVPGMIERLPGATALVVGDEEARRLADAFWVKRFENPLYDPHENLGMGRTLSRVNGEWRSSLITQPADGKAPLTEAGRKLVSDERAMTSSAVSESYETRPWKERCITGPGGVPLIAMPTDNLKQIVQTPDHLVIYTETDVGEARVIGIAAPHRSPVLVSHLGDSVAKWEGDDLVIETTGTRKEQVLRQGTLVVRAEARVVERLSFISPDEVLYRFTIIDPAVYDRPWSAEYVFVRTKAPMFEVACHEGNYSLSGILLGARVMERRAAAKK